jgi:hypothetical protein
MKDIENEWEVNNVVYTLSKYRQGDESCYATLIRILGDYHELKSMEYSIRMEEMEQLYRER